MTYIRDENFTRIDYSNTNSPKNIQQGNIIMLPSIGHKNDPKPYSAPQTTARKPATARAQPAASLDDSKAEAAKKFPLLFQVATLQPPPKTSGSIKAKIKTPKPPSQTNKPTLGGPSTYNDVPIPPLDLSSVKTNA